MLFEETVLSNRNIVQEGPLSEEGSLLEGECKIKSVW